MKKIFIVLMLVASVCSSAFAQKVPADCPEKKSTMTEEEYDDFIEEKCEEGNDINTNPANLKNDDCPDLKNDFEWRVKHTHGGAVPNEFYIAYDENGVKKGLRNPFNDDNNSEYRYLAKNHNSNYQPLDGWELIKVEYGALSNFNTGFSIMDEPGINTAIGGKKLPYMILYNKYSGTFRFFGALLGQNNDYKTIRIELRIPKTSPGADPFDPNTNVYQSDLKATNLLSIQGNAVQPLDQETEENVMVVFAEATNNESKFFWFDIPVAYDPCLCNIRSQLDITFAFVKTASIELNGDINAGIKTETKPDDTPYGLKLATGVLAAGIATALTIKTGGAVINFQAYTDLVKLIRENPNTNLTQQQKDNLTELENYLDCGQKFAKVIQKNYNDVTDNDKKKQYKAANDILDANTTFLSSLANGCSKKDNGATTISGSVNLSGVWTEETNIDNTEVKIAMPGSNWNDKNMQINSYSDAGITVPAYPTYNERLGTFALLETPKIKFYELPTNLTGIMGEYIFKFQLEEDLKYTFNPKMNINPDATKIYCRLAFRNEDAPNDIIEVPFSYTNTKAVNLYNNPNYYYQTVSPYVPIDNFKSMEMVSYFWDAVGGIHNSNKGVYLQIKILSESFDIGTNNEPNTNYTILTFPVKLNRLVNFYNWWTSNFNDVVGNAVNLMEGDKSFDINTTFTDDEILAYDGIVTITANMSTAPGKKVKIYSTMGFIIEPGVVIGDNIELIPRAPFEKIPQPPQTYTQVAAFCADNNKYKAQEFSAAAIRREKEEYDRRAKQIEEDFKKELAKVFINCSIHPNPNTGSFSVEFDKSLKVNAELTITDITGRSVYSEQLYANNSKFSINTNHLTPGVYFVSIVQGGEKRTTKIVIQ